MWRQTTSDAIYNNQTRLYARTQSTGERRIGTMPRITLPRPCKDAECR
ncbi:hypothetical protein O1K_13738 [Xanthomonas fragariae LMG 25863]|nr:hypothetical protein O1K_13738 [Xanthomonas fragariae LMG 25863]